MIWMNLRNKANLSDLLMVLAVSKFFFGKFEGKMKGFMYEFSVLKKPTKFHLKMKIAE
jgi:hypothetical protein